MKRFNWPNKNTTLFSVLGPVIIIFLVIYLIYLLIYENGGELAGLFCLLGIVLTAGIVILDRVFLIRFNNKMLSIAELLISACLFVFFHYQTRETIVDLSGCNRPYVLIVDNPKGIELKDFKSSGLFDKSYSVINSDYLLLNNTSINNLEIKYKNAKWAIMEIENFQKPKYSLNCTFVSNAKINYSKRKIDSIINSHILN
jgi:hypothetical protein